VKFYTSYNMANGNVATVILFGVNGSFIAVEESPDGSSKPIESVHPATRFKGDEAQADLDIFAKREKWGIYNWTDTDLPFNKKQKTYPQPLTLKLTVDRRTYLSMQSALSNLGIKKADDNE